MTKIMHGEDFTTTLIGQQELEVVPGSDCLVTDRRVKAFVSKGVWSVFCPDGSCGTVWDARQDGLFMCPACHNRKAGGKLLLVQFPVNKVAIEAELSSRPEEKRFWYFEKDVPAKLDSLEWWDDFRGDPEKPEPRLGLLSGKVSDASRAEGRIFRGRWVALCPQCGAVNFLHKNMLLLCERCNNKAVEGKFIFVNMPRGFDEESLKKLTRLLLKRPRRERNWQGESLSEVEEENIRNGWDK